jgi:hypothetical protein
MRIPLKEISMDRLFDYTTTTIAALLLGVLAILSIRGIVDPAGAAVAFGLPVTEKVAEFYHAVYRDRNLVIAATGIVFLVMAMWRALAILSTIAVSLPAYDIYALKADGIAVVPVHWITLAGLIVLTVLMWLRVARHRRRSGDAAS